MFSVLGTTVRPPPVNNDDQGKSMTDNMLPKRRAKIRLSHNRNLLACALIAACTVCMANGEAAYCQQGVPSQVLADLIRAQKLVADEQTVKAVLDQNQAIITCDRNPGDNDEACK